MGTGALTVSAVAGCMGNGDDEEDNGFFPYDRPDDWPDHEAFTPNPNVEGPGGDAMITLFVGLREGYRDVDTFEKMEVNFDQITMYRDESDEWIDVPVERTFDFYHFDIGQEIIPLWAAEIPTGTYSFLELHMYGSEVIHEEEGDVTDGWELPERGRFRNPLELEAGDQYNIRAYRLWVDGPPSPTVNMMQDPDDHQYRRVPGTGSELRDMTDPSIYEENLADD